MIRQGSIAGFVSAGVTAGLAVFAMATNAAGEFAFLNDPFLLADVVLAVALSVGVRRRSRCAALALLLYFVAAKVYQSLELGRPSGVFLGLLFVYFFARAVQGTFSYHRIRAAEAPPSGVGSWWERIVWPAVGAVAVGLAGIGVLDQAGVLWPDSVLAGHEVEAQQLKELRDHGILAPDEELVLLYAPSLHSVVEGGSALTDQRVISFATRDGELSVAAAPYSQVEDVTVTEPGSKYQATLMTVSTTEGQQLFVVASARDGGDRRFQQAIESRRDRARR